MEKLRNSQELMCENINAFSIKFGLPQLENPGFLKPEDMMYRLEFIQEELDELYGAHQDRNLEEALDALVDIMYVVLGTAWLMNLPIMDAWDRVHHANMQKERVVTNTDPRSKRHHHLDIVKPDGWIPPNLKDLLS